MALKKCKGCGKDVSKSAKACPACGAPIPKQYGCGCLALILLALFVIGALNSAQKPSTSITTQEPHIPKLPLKVGERCRISEGAMTFTDQSAFNEFILARKAHDTVKVGRLNQEERAYPSKGSIGYVRKLDEWRGMARLSLHNVDDFTSVEVFVAPAGVIMIPQAEVLHARGQPVAVLSGARMFPADQKEIVLELVKAELAGDYSASQRIGSPKSPRAFASETSGTVKDFAVDHTERSDGFFYLVSVKEPDGTIVEGWIRHTHLDLPKAERNQRDNPPDKQIETFAKEVYGESLISSEAFAISAGVEDEAHGLFNVYIKVNEGSEIQHQVENRVKELSGKIFGSNLPVWNVLFFVNMDLMDPLGNEQNALAIKFALSKETASRINWKNLRLVKFTNAWEIPWALPSIREHWYQN